MSDTKNKPLLEESEGEQPLFIPSEKELEVVQSVFYKFRNTADRRNQIFDNFDGLNLVDYIDDSYRRYTTNIDVRDDIEDWQSIVHDPMTRNKVNAVLSKVVAVLPVAELVPRGDEDVRKAQVVNEIYQYAEEVDDYEEFMVRYLLEALVKGTAIGYEGHEAKVQKIRKIVSGDGDEIKIAESEKKTNRLFAQVVRLEDFYPANVAVPRVKDLPYAFWREIMPFDQFLMDFAMYSKAALVKPHTTTNSGQDETPYYVDYISDDVTGGKVEVIRYYNKDTDEYIIVANGVWLNPIVARAPEVMKNMDEEGLEHETIEYKTSEEISPLPFNHKELPFFDTRFELFSHDFFYGKSLPDKLKSLQDVLNVLTNMLLDQSFLTVFQPILTNGFDSIEDDYLRPGRRTPIDTQGLPINQSVMTLDMKTPGNWHQFILQYTRNIMEEASVDKVSSGVAGQGDRTTAQEIRVAAEGVSAMLGLFGKWIKYGLKRKAALKTKNALQFWTDKNMAITEGILGGGGSKLFKDAFTTFKIKGATLSSGKRGTKVIGLFEDNSKRPTAKEMKNQAAVFRKANNEEIEYVAVSAEYIRNLDFDIKIVPNQKQDTTRDMEKAMQLEKVRVYLSFFPDMVNRQELLAETAEKMGDDPTKIINQEIVDQMLGNDNNPEKDSGVNTNPEGNISQNMTGGAGAGVANVKQLMGQMTG